MRRVLLFILCGLSTIAGYSQFGEVNSVYDEQYPSISPDGKSMYFTRANHPDNIGGVRDKGDIWYTTLIDDKWSVPINAGTVINNKNRNAVLGFSQSGNTILLHHHYQDNKQGLSISNRTSNGWNTPKSVKIPYFRNKSNLQSGSISNDGKIIMLSIESFNTKGGEDIYVLFGKSDGSWTDPKNIGSVVNTAYQEVTPYLAEDNKTLFFASNGHANSEGSFDIYSTVRQDDSWTKWSQPANLGGDINSEGRESSYQHYPGANMAIYVSTLDSDGYGDIKSIIRKDNIEMIDDQPTTVEVKPQIVVDETLIVTVADSLFRFSGMVKSAKTGELLRSTLLITAIDQAIDIDQVESNGLFHVLLPIGTYHLGIEAKGYLSKFLTINIDSVATNYHIEMSPIVVGETVNLESVLFERGTDVLLSSSYGELDAVVKMMEANTSMEIALGGHTDNQGSSKLNYNLSEKRVVAVKKYLQSKGVSGRRIEGKGYGGSRPIASNKNEETRKLNRRVEFTVTKK